MAPRRVLVIVTIVFFVRACMASPQSESYPPRDGNEAELAESKPPQHTEQPMAG